MFEQNINSVNGIIVNLKGLALNMEQPDEICETLFVPSKRSYNAQETDHPESPQKKCKNVHEPESDTNLYKLIFRDEPPWCLIELVMAPFCDPEMWESALTGYLFELSLNS